MTAPASVRDRQWLWALLPAFPVVLLALRLWLLSRQNLQTMLLLVQHVNPLGLISTLIVALIWVLPAAILMVRALSALRAVSDPATGTSAGSRLAWVGSRMPDWVLVLAVVLAGLTWQLRFLPALLMATLMIVGLLARQRYQQRPAVVVGTGLVLPLAAAVAGYLLLAPAIADGFAAGELVNALLLLLPPGMAVLLTGPVPVSAAQAVTRGAAIGAVVLAPVLIGVIFLRAPILPTTAIELDDPRLCTPPGQRSAAATCVVRGQIIAVDDRMTALLRDDGSVLFVANGTVSSQTLCATPEQASSSTVRVRGWHIEQAALDWMVPRSTLGAPDPRCQGRPLEPEID
ncbi:MAG: hypothetical protein ACRDUA_01380 [Micromonosporaceae bacterium]